MATIRAERDFKEVEGSSIMVLGPFNSHIRLGKTNVPYFMDMDTADRRR